MEDIALDQIKVEKLLWYFLVIEYCFHQSGIATFARTKDVLF